jgi:hypothetical protein
MQPESYKFALKAAAKVALVGAALFGCSSHRDGGTGTTQSKLGGDDSSGQCSCDIQDQLHPTDDDVACCQSVVDDAIASDGIQTDDQTACCSFLSSSVPAFEKIPSWYSSPEHDACCPVVNWKGPGCSPWGPPVPPAMRAEVA